MRESHEGVGGRGAAAGPAAGGVGVYGRGGEEGGREGAWWWRERGSSGHV